MQAVLAAIRARARDVTAADGTVISAEELRTWGVRIVSKNTFPTAAGLASSAAGYAAMGTCERCDLAPRQALVHAGALRCLYQRLLALLLIHAHPNACLTP